MKKKFLVYFFVILCCLCIVPNIAVNNKIVSAYSSVDMPIAVDAPSILDDLSNLFFPRPKPRDLGEVYLGGSPVGITLNGDGIVIINLNEVIIDGVSICPALNSGLKIGDRIIMIDGIKVDCVKTLTDRANLCEGKGLALTYVRKGQTINTTIVPAFDKIANCYRLGLWAKENSSGIGTLTFVKTNGSYACLGHPITDPSNGEINAISGGNVFGCSIVGVTKGIKGRAGELQGVFTGANALGSVLKNNKFGVYGRYDTIPNSIINNGKIKVTSIGEINAGKAQVYTTLEGTLPQLYDIDIVKVSKQSSKDDKGMVLSITDPNLLNKSGGIVQGMSGSPIIQNNKLVGAVTHVFINDPTKGYGMFAEWMLTECN